MKHQPVEITPSNDDIQTPVELCRALTNHFKPSGTVLEPCRGNGNWFDVLSDHLRAQLRAGGNGYKLDYCEIKEDKDFLTMDFDNPYNWIMTNPPWSKVGAWKECRFRAPSMEHWTPWHDANNPMVKQMQAHNYPMETRKRMGFLERSFQVAHNVVFLCTLNHLVGLKARYKVMDKYNMVIKEIVLLDTPPAPWPQMGFQLGAVHYQTGNPKPITMTDLRGCITYESGPVSPPVTASAKRKRAMSFDGL